MKRTETLVCVVGVLLLAAGAAQAVTRYVDADAPAGGNGLSWAAAYRNPQAALTAAGANDIIRVAKGTYMPDGGFTPVAGAHVNGSGNRAAAFQLKNGVRLEGGYAGLGAPNPAQRDIAANATVLSGDLTGNNVPPFTHNAENSFHVVTGHGTNATAVIEGFTISGANANAPGSGAGGGMVNSRGSPTVTHCTFQRLFDGDGDGVQDNCDNCPTVPSPNQADTDGDNDVDMNDFAVVQRCYSGPNVPGNPNCAP